ncbi:MAG: SagB/ThcOx family dehydrogenase [Planctomycetota bacterium]
MSTVINLPAPNKTGSMSLEEAIVNRRSQRDFLSKPLTIEQIGQIAWSAQGTEPNSGFRTVPSAGATYPLKLFLLTSDGLFHYLPAKHSLEKLAGNDLRADLATAGLGQGFIKTAPLTVVFAADFSRTTSHYGRRGVRYVYMEAGHAAQNVHLQAEALGLGSVAVGAFDDDAVSKVLALPNYLEPIYLLVVGYRRK